MRPIDFDTLQRALDQFNAGAYFECHETLEGLWLQELSDDRLLYQGLIQVAAAFVHWQHGRWTGMRRLLTEGLAKLDRFPDDPWGIPLADLRERLRTLLAIPQEGENGFRRLQAADLPTIRLRRPSPADGAEA